ncbi:hypothetical protein Dvina_30745 [Dactylosporangium vinaceum]|uniref:Uncharacterized protein n=1 Tax=Dactylosporangium vinaceum TaxID=53362 RepID=A0ABV5MJW2_9ACTN|nr:hypothetical protein [Dactylosporangium vinaceum]UAB92699.1 hypothetical protein Dvina_30745 [Dactylosporangium vinaceum]
MPDAHLCPASPDRVRSARIAAESQEAARRLARIRGDVARTRERIADARRRAEVRMVRSTARVVTSQEILRSSAARSGAERPRR